ncbi:hypothetical protein O181_033549 [Austropuccinia psidii MF-1]|uniref:GH18 domain-containing protein n=1 Tax=Austropuccinia psidii MF-1 TaxID=1389203 RepID=A0A9Q3CZE2_9BASI|nr:hypothetical protein [Austropuccinia psidii MF-1]
MGYYPSYHHRAQSPHQLNYSLYTDVLFFVVVPHLNFSFSFENLDYNVGVTLATQFTSEAKKQNVNTILSFGGWTGSRNFSNLVSKSNRKKFAQALVKFSKKLGFSGIDLDWEYPNRSGIGCNTYNPQDTKNFGLLLKEIRGLWPTVQLTAALSIQGLVGASGEQATASEVSNIARYLDFANLMAYDVYGSWAPTTGPIGPLKDACAPQSFALSAETGFNVLLQQGFKASQVVLGIPAYGKRLKLLSPSLETKVVNGIKTLYYQNHTQSTPPGGEFDDRPGKDVCGNEQTWSGSWNINEILAKGWLSQDQKKGGKGYKRYFDECSGEPFLTNGQYFIAYEDKYSTVAKARFTKTKRMAGIFFFDTLGVPDVTVEAARHAAAQ